MPDVYKSLYEARVTHTKNVKLTITDFIDAISSIIILSANNGLENVDSAVLLDINRTYLKRLSAENTRFENEMTKILNPKGQSDDQHD